MATTDLYPTNEWKIIAQDYDKNNYTLKKVDTDIVINISGDCTVLVLETGANNREFIGKELKEVKSEEKIIHVNSTSNL